MYVLDSDPSRLHDVLVDVASFWLNLSVKRTKTPFVKKVNDRPTYWWFAFDVMAAMLEVQHKGISY